MLKYVNIQVIAMLKRIAAMLFGAQLATAFIPAMAIENPYAFVVSASAINFCFVRFGYLTTDKALELLYSYANENGIAPFQVNNIFKSSSFQRHTEETISEFGGCQKIIAEFTKRDTRSKRGVVSAPGSQTARYYGSDPLTLVSPMQNLKPE